MSHRAFVLLGLVVLVACGDNIRIQPDAGPTAVCGDYKLEGDEECDDGDRIADAACDADCRLTCGNGTLDSALGERCDTGITTGTGVCPASCDDSDACTVDVLNEMACMTACTFSAITAAADDDGCCPGGADATTDNDCSAVCGNGVFEPGETCDTGITAGAGACPMACNDQQACTVDTLVNGNTCQAACTTTPITMPMDNDGCCPSGANGTNDNDCIGCGNGAVDPGETCDTAIMSGAGSCPTSCNDNMPCTTDTLANPGTCDAACVFPPITMPIDNDGCCPPGANANNDNNCMPVCGNGVVEGMEQCDDGNMNNADNCTNQCRLPPTAFRMADLDLRDPHVFVSFLGCRDVTDTPLVGFSVNGELQTNIQTDGDNDGFLDLSPTIVFRPLDQTNGAMTAGELHFAECTAPLATTSCSPGSSPPTMATITSQSAATCLSPIAGTLRPYTPAVTSATQPCFSSAPATVTIDLSGIPITLRDARVGATYAGTPATSLLNGLLIGFISETDANNTIIPSSFPLVGGQPLSSLLPGGSGNCAGHSDKDTNAVVGWWFYLNFTAPRVTWSDT